MIINYKIKYWKEKDLFKISYILTRQLTIVSDTMPVFVRGIKIRITSPFIVVAINLYTKKKLYTLIFNY